MFEAAVCPHELLDYAGISLISCRTEVSEYVCISDCSIFIFRRAVSSVSADAPPHPAQGARMDQYKTKWNNVTCEAGRSIMASSTGVIVFNHQVVVQEWASDPDSSPSV